MKDTIQLTELENRTLDFIRIYLKRKNGFTIEKVVPFILSNLNPEENISKRDIIASVYSLIEKRIVVPGSKITRDKIFDNKTREMIYNYITEYPGSYKRQIRDILKIGPHELCWHINVLDNFQLIRKVRFDRSWAYFDIHLSDKYDKARFYFRNKITYEIYTFIKEHIFENGITLEHNLIYYNQL